MTSTRIENLRVLYWNCHGIQNKYEDIIKLANDFDVIALQETLLNPDKNISFRNFHTFRKDRVTPGGGGLLTMVRNDICTQKIDTTYHKEGTLETLTIKLEIEGKPVHLTNLYRPPRDDTNFRRTKQWRKLLQSLDQDVNHLIMGDYNTHSSTWGSTDTELGDDLLEAIFEEDLLILNSKEHTHFPTNMNKSSAIDLALVSAELYLLCEWHPLKALYGSDHKPISINIAAKLEIPQGKSHRINLKKVDWEVFSDFLREEEETTTETFNNLPTEEKYEQLLHLIKKALELANVENKNKNNKKKTCAKRKQKKKNMQPLPLVE